MLLPFGFLCTLSMKVQSSDFLRIFPGIPNLEVLFIFQHHQRFSDRASSTDVVVAILLVTACWLHVGRHHQFARWTPDKSRRRFSLHCMFSAHSFRTVVHIASVKCPLYIIPPLCRYVCLFLNASFDNFIIPTLTIISGNIFSLKLVVRAARSKKHQQSRVMEKRPYGFGDIFICLYNIDDRAICTMSAYSESHCIDS